MLALHAQLPNGALTDVLERPPMLGEAMAVVSDARAYLAESERKRLEREADRKK